MTSNTTSSAISRPDFGKILRDHKYRTDEQVQIAGAKAFRKLFKGSLFRRAVRTEKDTLDIIVNCGLATDIDSAKQIVDYMTKHSTPCSNFFDWNFKLEECRDLQGNVAYGIRIFSSWPPYYC